MPHQKTPPCQRRKPRRVLRQRHEWKRTLDPDTARRAIRMFGSLDAAYDTVAAGLAGG